MGAEIACCVGILEEPFADGLVPLLGTGTEALELSADDPKDCGVRWDGLFLVDLFASRELGKSFNMVGRAVARFVFVGLVLLVPVVDNWFPPLLWGSMCR